MEKGFKLNNIVKKSLVCGLALMTLAGVGAGSSKAVNPMNTTTVNASSKNYRNIVNYLHWVQRYDHTHAKNIHTWKLTHLYYYMNGLSRWQYNNVKNLFNTYHTWYYNNDSALNNVNNYFNFNKHENNSTSIVRKNNSSKVYNKLVKLFYNDASNNSATFGSFNRYLAKNWKYLSNIQIADLQDNDLEGFGLSTFLNNYNNKIFESRYQKGEKFAKKQREQEDKYQQARYTATNKVPELSQQDDQFDTEVRADLVNDINKTRESYGLNPLTVTNAMQETANYRNPKVQYAYEHYNDYMNYPHNTSNPSDNWVHGEDTHNSGENYLDAHNYEYYDWGANAGNTFKGNNVTNGDGTPLAYNNNTAYGFAGNINDGIMNHDNCEGNYNGHRDNELNPSWKYLGVGVTYDQNAHMGSYNEQFAN